ncbi:50S ribosomal protein L6 [Candidatus Woesearchaeota archaeon]|nr:50S ribosomal protein L6 [Candidatus Woesearchaeota archaeon]
MKQDISEDIQIPEGIQVTLANGLFKVKGPKGDCEKTLTLPSIEAKIEGGKIIFSSKNATLREKKIIMTFIAHLKNLFKGVSEGHTYKLKVCSSHFPMTAVVKGSQVEVKNFYGEQIPRQITIPQGVSAKIDGQIIVLEGVNKELVSQTAATIEQSTKRPGFDKRRFQDGIFLIEKDGKSLIR